MKYGKHLWQYTSTDGTSMVCTECGLAINYSDSNFFEQLDSDCPEIVIDDLSVAHGNCCDGSQHRANQKLKSVKKGEI